MRIVLKTPRFKKQLLIFLILFAIFTIALFQGMRRLSLERGLVGYYYANLEWAGLPNIVTQDAAVVFSAKDLTFLSRKYSLQWKGYLYAPVAGNYQLMLPPKAQAALLLDERNILPGRGTSERSAHAAAVTLTPGFHALTLRYLQESGPPALYALVWTPPGKTATPIPSQFLFPDIPGRSAVFFERAFTLAWGVTKLIWLLGIPVGLLIGLLIFHQRIFPALNGEFLLLVLFLLLINLPYFVPAFAFFPIRDTMASVGGDFFLVYNEYVLHGELPFWMPYNLYGTQFDYEFLVTMSPALCLSAFLGKLLGVVNTLLLFKIGVLIEQLALLVGMYLLAKRLFANFAAAAFVCCGSVAVSYWALSIFWNFRIYYLMPLTLFFLLEFYDTAHFQHLFIAGMITILALLGDLAYYLPFYALFYGVFGGVLFAGKIRQVASQGKNLLKPAALVSCLAFCSLLAMFLHFGLKVFEHVTVYGGRDPLTGLGAFKDFFLLDTNRTLAPLLEMIYAIPTSHDITIYIGLLPFIFLGYALFNVNDQPIFKTLLLCSGFIFLLSLPYFTFMASLVYYFAPFLSYCRTLDLFRSVLKILLLLAAGFGVDHYLSAVLKSPSTRSANALLLLRLGGGLIMFIIGLDIFAFEGLLPYTPGSIFRPAYAYHFHYLALGIAAVCLYLLGGPIKVRPPKAQWIVGLCFVAEIASYHYFFFFLTGRTATFPEIPKQPYETVETYQQQLDFLKSSYNVRNYAFRNERTTREQTQQRIDQTAPLITRYFGPKYAINYSFAYVDPCLQDITPQYFPLPIERFVRARKGIPLDTPLIAGIPLPNDLADDPVFLHALGCQTPKLFLTAQVEYAASLSEAADMIHKSAALDKIPVLLTETFASQQLPPTQGFSAETSGEIAVTQFTANALQVNAQVTAPGGAWLIYLDGYHPDWTVTVNGQRRDIIPANLAFKAVRLDAGANNVHFRFRGNGFNGIYMRLFFVLGVASTLTLLAAAIWLSLPGIFKPTRSERDEP